MSISPGFYKKIYQWLMNEANTTVAFRPFLTNGNPYKSRVFLVGANATPSFQVGENEASIFAESLVDRELFMQLFHEQYVTAPREFKGSIYFNQWLEQRGESAIYTTLNTYQLEHASDAKSAEKEDATNFVRGQQIFDEVLQEFQPEIIILQGTQAFHQFKAIYDESLVIYNPTITKIPLLEEEGPFAEMQYATGKKAYVFITRSMSYFGKDGNRFERFKENLIEKL